MPPPKKASTSAASPSSTTGSGKGYKPPWIKEAAEPNKETETPWGIMKKRDAVNDPEEVKAQKRKAAAEAAAKKATNTSPEEDDDANFAKPQLRKVSLRTENGDGGGGKEATSTFVKPALKTVKTRDREPKALVREESKSKIVIPKLNSVKVEKMKELPPPPKKDQPDYRNVLKKVPTRDHIDDEKKRGAPAAPPMPPPPPPMGKLIDTSPLSSKQKSTLDNLRSRPKARPDWTQVLKGIESGAKLKHVETNDRSKPVLPRTKAKGQFLYESEKETAHNTLLKEIQQGIKLKGVKTNDRSKPNLEGLRKFRRQMTIEEQIQKSVSMASMASATPPMGIQQAPSMASVTDETTSVQAPPDLEDDDDDELDDIDRVRDDLQSTKQLLAIEMRNKEQCMRENRRLQSRIQNMEKDIDENRSIARNELEADKRREPDEKLIVTLKAEAAEARKRNADLEVKLTQAAKEVDNTRGELDEMRRRNSELEKRLQEYMTGKRHSLAPGQAIAGGGFIGDEDDVLQLLGDEDLDNLEDGEDENDEKRARRAARELKTLVGKLRAFKTKVDNAKKERVALKDIMRTHVAAIREEKRKYKQLQKEVDKMAALMKESDSDEEDEDEDEDGNGEESTTESETESSDSESESERSQSEPEDAPVERKKENVVARSRRHENRLSALKKTNFMLKTNAERLQDDLTHQKELTASLQSDLDSVLADLG